MIFVLHAVHAGLVLVGLAAVVLLLHESRAPHGRVDELRAAAAGNRLVADAERRALEVLTGQSDSAVPVPNRWTLAVAVGSLLAAGAHAFVSPEHYAEGLRFGVFFTLLTAAQLATAVAVLARPTLRLVVAVALLNAAVVVVWGVSRTVGLPFGLAEIEPVGALDLGCSIVEVGVVLCCVGWVRGLRRTGAQVQPATIAAATAVR